MEKQQISSFTSALYYIILVLVFTGAVWAWLMPVEITIAGRGYISFLGEPQAICVPEDGIVETTTLKTAVEVRREQKILTYQKLSQCQAASTQENKELLSPIDGILIGQRELIKGDILKLGERVALIYPSQPIGVKVYLNEQDLGRVQPQMSVRVRVDAYPFQNYGVVNGIVKELISQNTSVPGRDLEVVAMIELQEAADKRIILRPGLAAGVEIITGRTRLLNKLLF